MIAKQTQIARIARVRTALGHVLESRELYSKETYTQIVLALYDKIRLLQTDLERPRYDESADEIRLVTVMFVDVKDSTEIAQRLATDDWKSVIASAHSRMAGVIEQWGGNVGQYLGDGLLCFFGAHRSQDDDALRAVSAALGIQKAMAGFGRQIAADYQVGFGVRIGISTGRVVVGMIGAAGKKEFMAMGSTTNLAARLQGMAASGGVVIDAETHAHVQHEFVLEAKAPAELKGFEHPVPYYAVLGRHDRADERASTGQIAGLEIPFVGRDDEIERILGIWGQSLALWQFHVLAIYGAVGVGKSRLLQEIPFADSAVAFEWLNVPVRFERGTASYGLLHNLLSAYCNLSDDTPPEVAEYSIREYFASWPDGDAEIAAALIGYLTGFGFEDGPHIDLIRHSRAGQERVVAVWLARWLKGMAGQKPLLITIDNLQWADETSLAMLEALAEELADHAGLLVVTMRSEFRKQSPEYMRALDYYHEFELGLLRERETAVMLAAVLRRVHNAPAGLSELIIDRTQGNPLFVLEFLRMLFDRGVFEQTEEGNWKANAFVYNTMTSTLPNGLVGALQARLDELADMARHVTQLAATIGLVFWDGAVSFLADVDARPILDDLEERGIIARHAESAFEGEIEYEFVLTLYRDVAYEMLTRRNRTIYHRRAALWLREQKLHRTDHSIVLADHYLLGDMRAEALEMYLRAAEDLFQRGLPNDTMKLITRGLGAARGMAREVALPAVSQLWLLQAQTAAVLQRLEEASAECQTAIDMLNELPPDMLVEKRVVAARTLGDLYRGLGRYDDALQVLQSARDLLPEGHTPLEAAILRTYGMLYFSKGELCESLHYQQRALALAEQNHDRRQIITTQALLGAIELERGNVTVGLEYFEHVLEVNRQLGNIYYQVLDLRHIGMAYRLLFAYERALDVLNEAEELQSRIRYRDAQLQTNRGLCLIALGDADAGLELLCAAARQDDRTVPHRQLMRLDLIAGLGQAGHYEACHEEAQQFVGAVRGQNPLLYGRGLLWLGVAKNALKEPGAVETLNEALHYETHFGGTYLWLCYYTLGLAGDAPQLSARYYAQAADIFQAAANSLYARPALQSALLKNPVVQTVIAASR